MSRHILLKICQQKIYLTFRVVHAIINIEIKKKAGFTMDFVNFKKQKEKLYFYTERPEIYCVVDLKSGTVYESITNRTLYDFTVLQKYIHMDYDFDYHGGFSDYPKDLLSQIKAVIYWRNLPGWAKRRESILCSLRRLESAISVCYENNLECELSSKIESHIPAGFVNWLKEKREILSDINMNNFLIDKEIKENFSIEWHLYIALILKDLYFSNRNRMWKNFFENC